MIDDSALKAMEDIHNSPTARAMREFQDSPAARAMREFQDSPTARAMREFQDSPAARAMREFQDSPTARAMREFQDSPFAQALSRFENSQTARNVVEFAIQAKNAQAAFTQSETAKQIFNLAVNAGAAYATFSGSDTAKQLVNLALHASAASISLNSTVVTEISNWISQTQSNQNISVPAEDDRNHHALDTDTNSIGNESPAVANDNAMNSIIKLLDTTLAWIDNATTKLEANARLRLFFMAVFPLLILYASHLEFQDVSRTIQNKINSVEDQVAQAHKSENTTITLLDKKIDALAGKIAQLTNVLNAASPIDEKFYVIVRVTPLCAEKKFRCEPLATLFPGMGAHVLQRAGKWIRIAVILDSGVVEEGWVLKKYTHRK
jgi:hypothetical protein